MICCRSAVIGLVALIMSLPVDAHRVGHAARPIASFDSVPEVIRTYQQTGDDHVLERGEALLRKRDRQHDAQFLLHRAWLAQAAHRFDEARADLDAALELQPGNGEAWLLSASVALVQGEHEVSRRACRQVSATVDVGVGLACLARASEESDKARTYAQLKSLPISHLTPSLAAWVESILAELASAAGVDSTAHYQRAIQLAPVLHNQVAYADWLLGQGRPDEALSVLPERNNAPSVAVLRLLAKARLGLDTGREQRRIDRRFRAWWADADVRHGREMARFFLDVASEPELACDIAQENLMRQREPEDIDLLRRCEQASRG